MPILALILSAQGFPAEHVMQVAIGTSLAVIALTALSSTRAHHAHGAVRWRLLAWLAPGLVAGALLGAWTAHGISSEWLARIVGIGALAVALKLILQPDPRMRTGAPNGAVLTAAGGVIGWASALIGIGGGSLTVPFLRLYGLEMRQAVGTSAAGGIPIAWAGAAGFIITGSQVDGLPGGHWGYVSLPGFAAVATASVLLAPVGARLAHRLPQHWLQRAFAALLLVIGVTMVSGAV